VDDSVRTRRRIAVSALVVALPALVTCGLVAALFDATLLDYFPMVSDELAYYQQIATFVRAGFDGGYFTFHENPAPISVFHFGVHGPAFPIMYGLVGRLVGWTIASGPIFNLCALALATTVFIWMARLSERQIVVLGTIMLTSWWVTLMVPITMQESLNQAFMIVVAAFAVRLLQPDTPRRGLLLLIVLAILVVASVLRPTNWVVAIPLVLVGLSRRPWLAAAGACSAAIGIPIFWLVWRIVSAPIPGLPIELAGATGSGAVGRVWTYFITQIWMNAVAIFNVPAFLERPFFQYVMFLATGVTVVSGFLAVRALVTKATARERGGWGEVWTGLDFRVDVMNLLTLGLALAGFFGFYFDSEASISRVTAPFLLFAQLVLLATGCRRWLLAATIVASLFVAPSFITTYRIWRFDHFTYDRARFEVFRSQVSPLVSYHAGQGAWCNTLLTMSYDREIVGVPAGIGLSVAKPGAPDAPIRSKYLLLTGDGPERFRSAVELQPLGSTVLGDVFLNRNSVCE